MKLFPSVLASTILFTLLSLTQTTLARTPAESKYLASIDRVTKTLNDRKLARIHASISTNRKIQYGYEVCQALDRGVTHSDLSESTIFNGKTSVDEKTYASLMQAFAVHNLCPEHKQK